MKTVEITCDGCGADLTTRTNSVDYRLALCSEIKPGHGAGFYTDAMIYPAIDRAHHFCGLACLDLWRDREKHQGGLWQAWWAQWKEEHGTKVRDRIVSYPSAPDDILKEKKKEFDAAALAAFPMART